MFWTTNLCVMFVVPQSADEALMAADEPVLVVIDFNEM